MAQTYYELLGVAEDATDKEIDAAFKSKAREVHPDKVAPGSPYLRKVAAEAFKDLSEAKSVLLDHAERRKYDDGLAYMRGSTSSNTSPTSQPPTNAPASSGPSPQTPPQPPPATPPAPQPVQKQSFWKPVNSKLGIVSFAAGGVGCLLLLGGSNTVFLGLSLILTCLALLSWRHGLRQGTDPKILGGSVFLFIFALMSLAGWFEPSPDRPQSPVAIKQTTTPPLQLPATGGTSGKPSDFASGLVPKVPNALASGPTTAVKSQLPGKDNADRGKGKVAGRAQKVGGEDPILKMIQGGSPQPDGSPPADTSASPEPHVATPSSPPSVSNRSVPTRRADSLSYSEKQSIESVCLSAKLQQGPAAYDQCVDAQLKTLASAPRPPDLSSLSYAEKQSVESVCLSAKLQQGPAAYNRCVDAQVKSLASAPRPPDLSSLSYAEKQSVESVCLSAKLQQGPAAYNRCLVHQLEQLRQSSH